MSDEKPNPHEREQASVGAQLRDINRTLRDLPIDPMTGMVSVPIGSELRARIERLKIPGETDNDIIERALGYSKEDLMRGSVVRGRTAARLVPEFTARSARSPFADRVFGSDKTHRFVGLDEPVEVLKGSEFTVLDQAEISRMLGRRVEFDSQSRPILTDKEFRTVELGCEIRETLEANPHLDDAARDRILEALRLMGNDVPRAKFVKNLEAAIIGEEAMVEIMAWLKGPLTLGRATGSLLHKLMNAWRTGEVCIPGRSTSGGYAMDDADKDVLKIFDHQFHTFVIQHNWASAFKGAGDFDNGEISLPYEFSAFEFHIGGKRVIALFGPSDPPLCCPFVLTSQGKWVLPWAFKYEHGRMTTTRHRADATGVIHGFQAVADMIGLQVRAISISLEAEVAVTEVVRASHKLNAQRERKGKLPLYDYHVVSLSRRSRAPALPRDPDAEPGTRKRLHFRRGHWRHFVNHKTWIKWMLVGDPDLGFVDKEYRL